jgi:hypothetical protein
MIKKLLNRLKESSQILFLFMLIAIISGCASPTASDVKAIESRRITGILTSEDSKSFKVTIKGNRYLSYSSVTQVSPRGLILHFPDTALGNIETIYTPADNEIISSIEASEILEDKAIKSSVFIALKKKIAYDLTPTGEGLQISFPKSAEPPKETLQQKTIIGRKNTPSTTPIDAPVARRLEDVTVARLNENVIISVKADGVIKNYKAFTLNHPARIVLDMYHLQSPYEDEQTIAVESKWINQIRYCAHPDKVRLVLDTHRGYLKNYSATQAQNGLLIIVGSVPGSQGE